MSEMKVVWSTMVLTSFLVFNAHGDSIMTSVGSNVILTCNNTSRVLWYGPNSKDNDQNIQGVYQQRVFASKNKLFISDVHAVDEGEYTCKNGRREVIATFNVTIPALLHSTERQFYRHLEEDEVHDELIVGSMNTISVIALSPLTTPTVVETPILPKDGNVQNCVLSHSRFPYCQNHIRILASISEGIWLLCGTNGDSPTGYEFNITNRNLKEIGNIPCSNDPFHKSTAVYTDGTGVGMTHMYYGSVYYSDKTIQRQTYNDGVSSQTYMKGVQSNNWMKDPDFIESFAVGEIVLFFFREQAVEVDQNDLGPKIYSRVAKVCKKDVGGNTQLRNKWTSFQKARLTCSSSATNPFYFDVLQDVVTLDKEVYYALFTASSAISASAICVYTWSDIEEAFLGQFKYQPTDSSYWGPVPNVPTPRPGKCVNDSLTLPDTTLEFIANKPLMNRVVTPRNGKPLFVLEEDNLQQLEIDRNVSELIFYAASNRGVVYKIFSTNSETYVISSFTAKPFGSSDNVIWAIKHFGNNVYIGTDDAVQVIQVINCGKYRSVKACIRDPHCAWIIEVPENQCYNKCHPLSYVKEKGTMGSFLTYNSSEIEDMSPCPPDTPTNPRSTNVSPSSIQIEWSLGNDYNQSTVVLYRRYDSNWRSWQNVISSNEHWYTLENLIPGSLYEIKLYGINSAGNSSSSESIYAATLPLLEEPTDQTPTTTLESTTKPFSESSPPKTTTPAAFSTSEISHKPKKGAISTCSGDQEPWKTACIVVIVIFVVCLLCLLIARSRKKYPRPRKTPFVFPDAENSALLQRILSICSSRSSYNIDSNDVPTKNGQRVVDPRKGSEEKDTFENKELETIRL